MDHTNKRGESKVAAGPCSLPLNGRRVLWTRIITNLGVLDVVEGGLAIVETAEGVSEEDLRAATLAKIVA
jgi:3-oxoacid CoA-transferase subunit B